MEGLFALNFNYEGNALVITPSVKNNNQPASFISILRDAEVKNVSKVYRTPTQIMGNGGIIDWPVRKMDYSSCGILTGLVADSGASKKVYFKKILCRTFYQSPGENNHRYLYTSIHDRREQRHLL